jgi:ribonuclease BN (tRNA processing enzyme)
MVKHKIKILLLGTGYPFPHPDRSGPSVAILVNEQVYIIDAGVGAVRRFQQAIDENKIKSKQKDLNKLFLTHLHNDHTLGLPDLIFTPWVMGREEPLQICGPKGTSSMVQHIEKAYSEDISIRINGLENGNKTGYKTKIKEINSGLIYRDDFVKVKSFKVKHGSWKYAYGFSFLIGNKKIVISGDTKPHPNIIKEAKGADVLIHEVVSDTEYEISKKWTKYLRTFHTSASELAEIANKTKPKKLILVHQIHRKVSAQKLVQEIKNHYSGQVKYGRDLDIIII